MKSAKHRLGRVMAVLLALILAFPASNAGVAIAQQSAERSSLASAAPTGGPAVAEDALPENPAPQGAQQPAQGSQAGTPQAGRQSGGGDQKPVGTAAAPYEPTVGIAGSRPAGAAIAPAKQRRVRTIVISLGVIAGAGIALGSVAALSHGSPSRP